MELAPTQSLVQEAGCSADSSKPILSGDSAVVREAGRGGTTVKSSSELGSSLTTSPSGTAAESAGSTGGGGDGDDTAAETGSVLVYPEDAGRRLSSEGQRSRCRSSDSRVLLFVWFSVLLQT